MTYLKILKPTSYPLIPEFGIYSVNKIWEYKNQKGDVVHFTGKPGTTIKLTLESLSDFFTDTQGKPIQHTDRFGNLLDKYIGQTTNSIDSDSEIEGRIYEVFEWWDQNIEVQLGQNGNVYKFREIPYDPFAQNNEGINCESLVEQILTGIRSEPLGTLGTLGVRGIRWILGKR